MTTSHESALVRRFASLLPPDAVWVDGGGGIGAWTALVLEQRPDAVVEVFEPLPRNAAIIRERFASSPGVRVHEEALTWYVDGVSGLTESMAVDPGDPALGSSVVRRGGMFDRWQEITVPGARLADLPRVDFLKLDVEGAEWDALQGIGGHRPAAIQFEFSTYTWPCGGEDIGAAVLYLLERGYVVFPFNPRSTYCNVVAVQEQWARGVIS